MGNKADDTLLVIAQCKKCVNVESNQHKTFGLFVRTVIVKDDIFTEWVSLERKLSHWGSVSLPGKFQLIKFSLYENISAHIVWINNHYKKFYGKNRHKATACEMSSPSMSCTNVHFTDTCCFTLLMKHVPHQQYHCHAQWGKPYESGWSHKTYSKVVLLDRPEETESKFLPSDMLTSWNEAFVLCRTGGKQLPKFSQRDEMDVLLSFFKVSEEVPPMEAIFIDLILTGRRQVSSKIRC